MQYDDAEGGVFEDCQPAQGSSLLVDIALRARRSCVRNMSVYPGYIFMAGEPSAHLSAIMMETKIGGKFLSCGYKSGERDQ